jgi:hypothetical protein
VSFLKDIYRLRDGLFTEEGDRGVLKVGDRVDESLKYPGIDAEDNLVRELSLRADTLSSSDGSSLGGPTPGVWLMGPASVMFLHLLPAGHCSISGVR